MSSFLSEPCFGLTAEEVYNSGHSRGIEYHAVLESSGTPSCAHPLALAPLPCTSFFALHLSLELIHSVLVVRI